MAELNFDIASQDHDLLMEVVRRVHHEHLPYGKTRTLMMDLTAVHANGCPLDFKGLLEAPLFDFTHDIYGIREHLNRDTGKLEHCFTPRFALANRVPSQPAWVRIDGEEYTQAEADLFEQKKMIEPCFHDECNDDYHAREGYGEADLLVTLERAGMGPRIAAAKREQAPEEGPQTELPGGVVFSGGTAEQHDTLRRRGEVVAQYCAARGWEADNLTLEQVLEIRSQPDWR